MGLGKSGIHMVILLRRENKEKPLLLSSWGWAPTKEEPAGCPNCQGQKYRPCLLFYFSRPLAGIVPIPPTPACPTLRQPLLA